MMAKRGLLTLVKDLRKKKADGDARGFMEMILDAADQSGSGTLAMVNSMVGAGGGTGASAQLADDVAVTKTSVEGLQRSFKNMEAVMERVCAGLNQIMEKNGLDQVEGLAGPGGRSS